MNPKITEQALNNIRARKKKNQDAYKNKMAMLENDKNYQKTIAAYNKIMIENRRKEVYGEKPDLKTEEALLKNLTSLKARVGLENLKMQYDCPLCKDEGYVDGRQCNCLKSEISKLLLEGSGFVELEDFDKSIETAGKLAPTYRLMKEWCNTNSAKNLVYLCGPIGVGKTHLLRCMAKELISNGKVIDIASSLNLSLDFKSFNKTSDEELLKKYITPDVLFIDDLGAEPIFKNITLENLYLIINERKMRKKRTVITSNLDLSDISERYDERIYSRIVDRNTSITILLDGNDRRIEKK